MWIIFALGASILWGLTYTINEQIYQKISPFTSLAISSFFFSIITLIISLFLKNFKNDISNILSSRELVLLLTLETIGLILAEFFIAYSIIGKNATISGLIEISYPLFIALFSFLIFREYSINTQTIIGGLLIFCGVIVIYYFNK